MPPQLVTWPDAETGQRYRYRKLRPAASRAGPAECMHSVLATEDIQLVDCWRSNGQCTWMICGSAPAMQWCGSLVMRLHRNPRLGTNSTLAQHIPAKPDTTSTQQSDARLTLLAAARATAATQHAAPNYRDQQTVVTATPQPAKWFMRQWPNGSVYHMEAATRRHQA
jgi:hypothetical protein